MTISSVSSASVPQSVVPQSTAQTRPQQDSSSASQDSVQLSAKALAQASGTLITTATVTSGNATSHK